MMRRGESDRKSQFKNLGLDNGRRRREETTLQLRKAKREEQMMKRRQAVEPAAVTGADQHIYTKADIPALMAVFQRPGINPNDPELLRALEGFRRMLSVEVNPPVQEVLDAGALPYFVESLKQVDNPTMVFEAAWALTNVASTELTQAVVDCGALPMLIRLLQHEAPNVREQAAWCLGNIAGDSQALRDLVLENGALSGLLHNLYVPASDSLLQNVTWTVSNLCRGKPGPNKEVANAAVGPLAALLSREVSNDVKVDAAWALSYLADGDNWKIEMVMETNVTPVLIGLLSENKLGLTTPIVRTLGNFVTGTDAQTQAVVDAGVIGPIANLLEHPNKSIRKESCWLLSNIAAGTPAQIDTLLKEREIVEKLVKIAIDDTFEVRKEAIWTISNIFTTSDSEYNIRFLVQHDSVNALIAAMKDIGDPKILVVTMEALDKFLELGAKLDVNYNTMFDELEGIDYLERLQEHSSEEVYTKAVELIEKYFGGDEYEDENIAPAQEDGMFAFGMGGPAKQLFPADQEGAHDDKYAAPVLGDSNNNWHGEQRTQFY